MERNRLCIKYDDFGLPILKDIEIEKIAYKILRQYNGFYLTTPSKTPIAGLFDYFKKESNLQVVFDDMGIRDGYKILGKTIFSKNTIFIDKGLDPNGHLFLFTSAHELGHWILHKKRKIKLKESDEDVDLVDESEENFRGKKELKTTKDWMEHHANIFAACLLMPKGMFEKAVIYKQEKMGITRNIGKIYLDDRSYSKRDFEQIVLHLRDIFGTSRTSVEIRLKKIGILEDKRLKAKSLQILK